MKPPGMAVLEFSVYFFTHLKMDQANVPCIPEAIEKV